jgi:hypothetical protein
MIHMRQPFFSVISATIYFAAALMFAGTTNFTPSVTFGDATLSTGVSWAISGLCFVMAYFSLVHLKHK